MTGTSNNRLKDLRRQAGLTVAGLAMICGVGHRTIERWEREETAIPDGKKRVLCEVFGVTADHLLGWDGAPTGEQRAKAGRS